MWMMTWIGVSDSCTMQSRCRSETSKKTFLQALGQVRHCLGVRSLDEAETIQPGLQKHVSFPLTYD